MIVAVIGGGTCSAAEARSAEVIGRLLAEAGAVLVCGGRGGVMAAACRGAKSAGGVTIGVLPGEDASEANPWVDVPIVTGMAEGRNLLIIYNADGIIALPGGSGTLSEIALALKTGTPVVDLGGWRIPGMLQFGDDPQKAVSPLIEVIQAGGPAR